MMSDRFANFDISDWLGDWESFEHYIDAEDETIRSTWDEAEQVVLANPQMAPMAANGIRKFWAMACSTTSPENIIHIGYWTVGEPESTTADVRITWYAEDNTNLDAYDYRIDHVIEHGLEGSPTYVFVTDDPHAEDSPFRWLLSIAPLPSRTAFSEGGLLSHLHFQYANDLHTLVETDDSGAETLRNPRWYATMCADEGTIEDRCRIIRALHHLD
ncbi:hypothetical protein [Bifidobacterium scaligerum]|uniref:Uncharacterized protein n=1 Tax=Bifidobacterium scaligerum TaxID=2052656 RepID=A0A2M9HSY6_9BIFI|nr:hypothetical protein [Bifidobacterium scaligerum]PJM79926.1 hypothetical protein CUU80_01970 [Bifidobacterium scaligerum]